MDADGDGANDPVAVRYVLDGWNPSRPTPVGNENWDVLAELHADGSLKTRYLRGDVVDQLFARVDGEDPYWYLTDRQGSIRHITDATGTVVDTLTYDGYGNILSETNPSLRGNYAYTSREYDTEIDLQYNRARYYDPSTGRWLSQDPLGYDAGDSNLYRYVHNRPTGATDPSGLSPPGYENFGEKIFHVQLIGLHRAQMARDYANLALSITQKRFPGARLHNDKADAWRHAFWSALMSSNPGLAPFWKLYEGDPFITPRTLVVPAYDVGRVHEVYGQRRGQPQIEFSMDMHNNNVGLTIGAHLGWKTTQAQIIRDVDAALERGDLIWIEQNPATKTNQLTGSAIYKFPRSKNIGRNPTEIITVPVYYYVETNRAGIVIKTGEPHERSWQPPLPPLPGTEKNCKRAFEDYHF